MSIDVHPAAAIFPLMGERELASLAEDIKTNGLRQPIVLAADGRILDGRNRLAACEIAGVEPSTISSNGDDPVSLVVSLNVKRRNLTAGQRAISAAEAWGLAIEEGKAPATNAERAESAGKNARAIPSPRDHFAKLFDVSSKYVQQARALVGHAPDLADQVKSGLMTMTIALEELATREREAREREAEAARRETAKQRMRDEHADLLEAMERDEMDVIAAMAEVARREEKARADEEALESERRVAVENLTRCLIPLNPDPIGVESFAARFVRTLGDRFDEFDADTLRKAGEILLTMAKEREDENRNDGA